MDDETERKEADTMITDIMISGRTKIAKDWHEPKEDTAWAGL